MGDHRTVTVGPSNISAIQVLAARDEKHTADTRGGAMGNLGPVELLGILVMLVIGGGALFGIVYVAVHAATRRQ